MTKLSRRVVDPKQFGYYVNDLWLAFTLMDSKDDMRLFFHDLFTHTEYKMFAKRLQIARLLIRGEEYSSIKDALKVTDKTIATVSNTLAEKGTGFRKVNEKLSSFGNKKQKWREELQKNLESPFRRRLLKGK